MHLTDNAPYLWATLFSYLTHISHYFAFALNQSENF